MPSVLDHRKYIQAAIDAAEADGFSLRIEVDDDLDHAIIIEDGQGSEIVWVSQ